MRRRLIVVGVAWTLVACGPPAPAPPAPPVAEPLSVEHRGCHAVLEGPTCELSSMTSDQEIIFWAPGDGPPSLLRVDGVDVPFQPRPIAGGWQWRTVVSPKASRLEVVGSEGNSRFVMKIAARPASPLEDRAKEHFRAASDQPMEMVVAELDQVAALLESDEPEAFAGERGRVRHLLGRKRWGTGDFAAAERAFTRAHDELVRAKRWSGALEVVRSQVSLHQYSLHDATVVATWRERGRALPAVDAEGLLRLEYGALTEVEERGRERELLRRARELLRRTERIDEKVVHLAVTQLQARALQRVGRLDEAIELLTSLRASVPSPPEVATKRQELTGAWAAHELALTLMLRRETGQSPPDGTPEPTRLLEEARRVYRAHGEREDLQVSLEIDQAFAALLEGRPAECESVLERLVTAGSLRFGNELAARDLWGRLRLAQGRLDEAALLFADLQELAEALALPDHAWRAWMGQAEVAAEAGRVTEALEHYRAARSRLDEASLAVPVGEGRDTFHRVRELRAGREVDLLVREGRVDEAFRQAQLSHSRWLRQLPLVEARTEDEAAQAAVKAYQEARALAERERAESWQWPRNRLELERQRWVEQGAQLRELLDQAVQRLATTEPPPVAPRPPRPGELILLHHRLPDGGLLFAATTDGVVAHPVARLEADDPPERQAAVLLEPCREAIVAARTVEIRSSPALAGVDWHRLPLDGVPLLEHVIVRFGLGLPKTERREVDSTSPALLIVDPSGRLGQARAEGDQVEARWREQGRRFRRLDGRAATRGGVLAELARTDLVHVAGHGELAGADGFEGALELADGRLEVGDVLLLPQVPRRVFLMGCDTASGRAVSLAHAFLLAGAEEVIASTRPVDDRATRLLAEELHRDSTLPLAESLRRAQRAALADQAGGDAAAFRCLVR